MELTISSLEGYHQQEKASRRQRDFVTNPVFSWLMAELQEMSRKEMISLTAASRGKDITAVNHGAGKIDGIDLVMTFLSSFQRQVLGSPKEDDEQ